MNWLIHHMKRVLRITSGVLLLVVGVVLTVPGVPGPGLLLIFLGLSVLAVDFVWAHRAKTYMKSKGDAVMKKLRGQSPSEPPVKKV